MKPREVLDITTTPDGERMELSREGGHYVIRVAGAPLMSSATSGSERAMAKIAAGRLGDRRKARVLVGGLGLGFTLRAALDAFAPDARVTVAELLPRIVAYNREHFGELAGHPLDDRRVRLFEGDVRRPLREGGWHAVLLDVDNGPSAFTTAANAGLYDARGAKLMAGSLAAGGVLVVWSAYPDRAFERRLRRAGLHCEARTVRARADVGKGGRHTLFVAVPR